MDITECNVKDHAVMELNITSRLIQAVEKKVLQGKIKAKECEELKLLKEKCCSSNAVVSLNAFHGIMYLVEKQILISSQTISMIVSLLPSVKQFGGLVSSVGNILLSDFQNQTCENKKNEYFYNLQSQHPFLIVLKYNWEKSWFEVYNFVLGLIQRNEDMSWESKIEFIRPIFRHIFWSSELQWQGSELQLKLFNALIMEFHEKKVMNFALETLLWQELNIHFCLFLQEFFNNLLKKSNKEAEIIAFGLTPLLAFAIKWLIVNGYNPNLWLKILRTCVEKNMASGSAVLFILTDVVMDTPSIHIIQLIDVCKSIIFSSLCSKYVAFKFIAVILNWFVSPSFLANPVYKTLERILDFMSRGTNKWHDQTSDLNENEYYRIYGSSKKEVKFAVELIDASNRWMEGKTSVKDWLMNLRDSSEFQMQLKVHSFIEGILLCEKDIVVINLCLEILFKLIHLKKMISFSLLCLLFYKLGREADPRMQKIYLFSLPKLSVKKENIPLIVGIVESLKRGPPRLMTPLILQLYLSLWKSDNRTYSYLHKMLHDGTSTDFEWELNVSKAIALKEICRLAPHLHAKDLVGVLSRILNECSGNVSGLPSAIAIEAVTELCKAYVIDVAGTWNAIQPKLRIDQRPVVIASLCRFFREIPNLNSCQQEAGELTKDIVPMLWNYTFFKNKEVVKNAFRALSNFPIESLPLKYFPENYRVDIKIPKDLDKNFKGSQESYILQLPYVPAECWVQFLQKVDEEVLEDAGELVIVLLERELTSLPRGIFYLPPEKSEPLNYSNLSSRSVCRGMVESLQKHSRGNPVNSPGFMKEIIRILAYDYSKFLPPLNWSFLENLINLNWEVSRHCLALLAKQASVSPSAKSILEKYFSSIEWNETKWEEILLFYSLIPLLCKGLSYSILQDFIERTLKLSLEAMLNRESLYFEKIMENLKEALKNKTIQLAHKNLIAKQAEKIMNSIPHEHEAMKKYAMCATEFPVKLIEEMTSVKVGAIDYDWLRRAVTIRSAIAMRSDIKNPLVWLSELIEAVAHYPKGQSFVFSEIWTLIRSRRNCDHRSWVHELTWRIQAFITASSSEGSVTVTLFLVDVFITTAIILSGYDCLFMDVDDFISRVSKRLEIFPQALCDLLASTDWSDMLPKVGTWLQKLSKWKHLPQDRVRSFTQALLMLREIKFFGTENESSLFNFSLPIM